MRHPSTTRLLRAGVGLAAVLATLPCAAQSSVTLFGVVDTTISHGSGSGAGATKRTQMTGSGNSAARLGFRGTEDLGGGLAASFWLEAGFSPDSGIGAATNSNNQTSGAGTAGGLVFNRRSTVSLEGRGWGEIRLGRDLTAHFRNLTVFDPFETNGVGTAQTLNGVSTSAAGGANLNVIGPTAVRVSNAISYWLPSNIGGFYGQVQHFLGENPRNGAATQEDGTGTSVRIGWARGPVNLAISASRISYATTATTGDVSVVNIGGHYDIGPARIMAHVVRDRADLSTPQRARGGLLGVVVNVGAGQVKAAYSTYRVSQGTARPESSKLAVGYVHNLSKRTAVYTTVARIRNSGGANASLGGAVTAANGRATGIDIGLRHSF